MRRRSAILVRMKLSSAVLAALLRTAHHDEAATAVDAGAGEVTLSVASRENLMSIYTVRQKLQEDAGRRDTADEIKRLLAALAHHRAPEIVLCVVSDEVHRHFIILDRGAERVLAVVVPPRRVDDPAPPLPDDWRSH